MTPLSAGAFAAGLKDHTAGLGALLTAGASALQRPYHPWAPCLAKGSGQDGGCREKTRPEVQRALGSVYSSTSALKVGNHLWGGEKPPVQGQYPPRWTCPWLAGTRAGRKEGPPIPRENQVEESETAGKETTWGF